jgi:hypothetical protein
LDTLRIEDLGEDEQSGYSSAPQGGSSVLDSIKRQGANNATAGSTGTVSDDPAEGANVRKIHAKADSTKLRDFINNLDDDE